MKLAEALMLRAELKKDADDLLKRLEENAVYDEERQPMEDSKELFNKMINTLLDIRRLEEKIWKTNMNTVMQGKKTIYDFLRDRDHLVRVVYRKNRLINMYKTNFMEKSQYYYKDETNKIKKFFAFDIKTLIAERDEAAKKCREINLMIQRKNWEVELLD